MSILDYWSHDFNSPRQTQVEVLKWIEDVVTNKKKRYIICECPVGTGKSHIGVTAARWISGGDKPNSSYVVTPQRILQQQYENTFKHKGSEFMVSLYGKSAYECCSRNTTCDVGSLLKPKCPSCPNALARQAFKRCSCGVTNYSLLTSKFPLTSRTSLVLDECHNIEQILCDADAVQLSKGRCNYMNVAWKPETSSREDIIFWMIDSVFEAATVKAEELAEYCDRVLSSGSVSSQQAKTIQSANSFFQFVEKLEILVHELQTSDTFFNDWVFIKSNGMYTFKRLYAAHAFKHFIEPLATNHIIMLSSTVLDVNVFCKSLGIPRDEVAFISTDSPFSAEHRPVYYKPVMKMNAQWASDDNDENRGKMLTTIVDICNKQKTNSGIIHTGNYKISQWLVANLAGKIPQKIVHHNPTEDEASNRNQIITEFTSNSTNEPALLISPSITEGLDLAGDTARFAIFAKIPFGNLGDEWIKRRMEISSRWYQIQALIEVIQGAGRVVRSEDDWGEVYILDSSWGYLFSQMEGTIPDWWKIAYRGK